MQRRHFLICSIKLSLTWYQSHIRHHKKIKPISFMNADKTPQHNTANLATYLEDCMLWPSGFYSQNSRKIQHKNLINYIYHTNRMNEGKKRSSQFIQNILPMSILLTLTTIINYVWKKTILKVIYEKLTTNIIFNN